MSPSDYTGKNLKPWPVLLDHYKIFMKINDFIYEFNGDSWNTKNFICRARLFIHQNNKFMLLTDLGDKSVSTSITNCIETIRANLLRDGHICEETRLIEHYQDRISSYGEFDLVQISDEKTTWKKISISSLTERLGCSENELLDHTLKNQRLFKKIEQIRSRINPFIDAPLRDPVEVINRRNEINSKKIKKEIIQKLLENRASETELHKLLLNDLSVLGEHYAQPRDEYIVFSEFKLLNGFIDFVIFSGRSRMDVTFIEIKGAEFDILNSTGYENFSAKTNEALQQIRSRLGDFHREYPSIRKYCHEIRNDVEKKNKNIFNCFLGPKKGLGVDPNKDINIRTVVIAGRGVNDIEESKKRHDVEWSSQPPIRLESWDSFLNKLDRE